ncbi:PaaI family thioesterase [Methylobacterium isbiliense]|uniref:Medium/long-chain acyl-CoA thioesterase YigI n=1 Tax=Methylobacterium isbiliense TaxID=315478 RepID=A0ABQ4SJ19_9HYPH|nr:PaaI family thioesterase [Methylobacterium isbiliense]MDN3627275.1 PaaI family thioesterase [Methylobacterium isbiliense]GJE02341.1 1,4-dihydroxy-2-naphthoyl-CoA hydrolase [Methylobacterium isbiliense]
MSRTAMSQHTFRDPGAEARVRASFAHQGLMATLGADLILIAPGRVEIALPYRPALTQQNGYFHAGGTAAIADSAGGYAGFTLFPANTDVLTVEFKLNLVAPAEGDRLVAVGEVIRAGRTLTVCDLKVYGERGDRRTLCAAGMQTLICVPERP